MDERGGGRGPDRLEDVLGGPAPAGVAALPAEDRAALAEVVELALQRQAEHLAEAFSGTLRFVPFPLRGVVKRTLFG